MAKLCEVDNLVRGKLHASADEGASRDGEKWSGVARGHHPAVDDRSARVGDACSVAGDVVAGDVFCREDTGVTR